MKPESNNTKSSNSQNECKLVAAMGEETSPDEPESSPTNTGGDRQGWRAYFPAATRRNSKEAQSEMDETIPYEDVVSRCVVFLMTLVCTLFLAATAARANTYNVTTTADNGNDQNPTAGSLRKAIKDANANAGSDTINFSIPGTGWHTISLTTLLPAITDTVDINGYSQSGSSANSQQTGTNAVPLIELNGNNSVAKGLTIYAPNCAVRGLILNRFKDVAIYVYSNGVPKTDGRNTSIGGCFIGTNAAGVAALPNGDGIFLSASSGNLIGGAFVSNRNLISGNLKSGTGTGVVVTGLAATGNLIAGNLIGTDKSGTGKIPNGTGILVDGAHDNNIGGGTTSAINVVSGNTYGIDLSDASNNVIVGNYVGTDSLGTSKLGNEEGIILRGFSSDNQIGQPNMGNVISGNDVHGLYLASQVNHNSIFANYIGTAKNGTSPLGNGVQGIHLISAANNNLIGGVANGTPNVIAYNETGIFLSGGIGNAVLRNSIYSNTAMGIDLSPQDSAVNPNDPNDGDSGSNELMNYPIITSATTSGNTTTITGLINTQANAKVDVQFYDSPQCDASGYGEGKTFVGSSNLTTVGNDGSFIVTIPALPIGDVVTATATSLAGSTSEFSQCKLVSAPAPKPNMTINDVVLAEGNSGTTPATFTVSLSNPSSFNVSVNYATADVTAVAGSDYQANNGMLIFNPGETSKTVTVMVNGDTQVEASVSFLVNLSNPTNATLTKSQGTGTIVNDDNVQPPQVQFSQSSYAVSEDLAALTITVSRTGDSSGPAAVDYLTVDGSATQKADFEYAAGRLVFNAGEISKTFQVLINEDMYTDVNESFSVQLSNPSGASLGGQSTTTVNITDDAPESVINPIDEAQLFVHTHYHDFLNREPDASGLAFWTNEIASCGGDQQCIEVKRINVSAAYFLSIEFQQTGFLLHLLQKESYGTLPKYAAFMRDLRAVGDGVIVNAPGWQQKLANNQQQLADEWVNRTSFKMVYDGLSNADYVNSLYANAGVAAPAPEKAALVSALDASNKTRATVLLEVAQNAAFRQQEQNPSFVLMQYFGYLRRDPDAAPDSDLSGYNFWLTKLNSFGGDYQKAEMVKAFLISLEYRSRFGL